MIKLNKGKIVQELDTYVKNIDSCFSVNDDDNDLNLYVDGVVFCFFVNFNVDRYAVDSSSINYDVIKKIMNCNIIKKFYDKAVELLKKNENKYTVQVIKTDKYSFLNYRHVNSKYFFANEFLEDGYKTRFTESEIEALKHRDDIAIDWDKAIIKEVN